MTLAVQNLLRSFEALPESEKREFVFEILRRSRSFDLPQISDEELVSLADDLFQNLDEREAASQKPRASWERSFRALAKTGEDELLDAEALPYQSS